MPSGAAVRIFTGAVMPAGTDAVAMHEFCRPSKDSAHVQIDSKLTPGSNNRPAGENLRQALKSCQNSTKFQKRAEKLVPRLPGALQGSHDLLLTW